MIELFVEGQPVDVNEGFSTLLTMAIDDIKDFGAKNTTFSKTIILPGTKTNNALFGHIFEVTASNDYLGPSAANVGLNFNAAIGAAAYIFADNMQVFKGIIRILEIVEDDGFIEYETAVFGELGGFLAKLGNKKLEELDFSAYDHVYSYANIIATWSTAAAGAGYYYPLADYGTYSTDKHSWQYRTFRPALYVKEYIEKIVAATGYAIDFPLMSTARFEGLIIPHSQKTLQKISSLILDVSSAGDFQTIGEGSDGYVEFPIHTTMGSFTTGGSEFFQYTSASAFTGTLEVYVDFEWTSFGPPAFSMYLEHDSGGITNLASQTGIGSGGFSGGSMFFTWTVNNVTVALNDVFSVRIAIGGSSPGNYVEFTTFSAHMTYGAPGSTFVNVNLGEDIQVNDVIPRNILQKDFFSSIVKLFNLYIFEDYELDKTLRVMPFVDYYLSATSVDWSNKVDRSKPLRVKPMSELNSRYFEFTFKSDGDYFNDLYKKRYNEDYGTYKYDSQYEFAHEVQKVEVIFSGTPLVGYPGEDKVYSTIFKKSGTTEENIDSNIRILQAKQITGVSSWSMLNGATVLGSPTSYGYAGHLDDPDAPANDIQFGVPKELFFTLLSGALNVNQFNVYWSPYMAEITDKDSRLVTCTARLTNKDVYQIDFSQLIWMDGNLYRLNSIEDFNATKEDTCKVQLLKIINRIY